MIPNYITADRQFCFYSILVWYTLTWYQPFHIVVITIGYQSNGIEMEDAIRKKYLISNNPKTKTQQIALKILRQEVCVEIITQTNSYWRNIHYF